MSSQQVYLSEVLRNGLAVDMLIHAIDNPAPATIIVISGDRDFAYAISTLRLRQYDIVLITLSNAHLSLTSQASICYDWAADILAAVTDATPAAQATSEGSGQRGDADGFKFPPVKVTTVGPSTPSRSPNIPLPAKTSPQKPFARPSSSYFQQIKGPYMQSSNSSTASGSGLFQNMNPSADLEESTTDIFNHYYSNKASTSSASTSQSSIGPEEQDQDPFLVASRCYPSPRISSVNVSSSPERPLSRATPARSSLEVSSPTPQRTSFEPISSPITFGSAPYQPFAPISVRRVRGGRGSSFSESSCSSSQYASAGEEPELPRAPVVPEPVISTPKPSTVVPPHYFKPLIELLQSYHARGIPQPFRPSIAMEIISGNNTVYQALPNVKNFTDYAQLAEKAGVVHMGGEGGEGWIALTDEHLKAKLSP